MKLHGKILLWIGIIISIFIVSSFLSFSTLKRLHVTSVLVSRDSDRVLKIRRLRNLFLSYHIYSISYAISEKESDLNRKKIFYTRLLTHLKSGIGPSNLQLQSDWNFIDQKISDYLLVNHPKEKRAERIIGEECERYLVEVSYRLDNMIAATTKKNEMARLQNENFYYKIRRTNLIIFSIGLLLLILGFFYFKRKILNPIFVIIKSLENIRGGDLSSRAIVIQKDELGRMAQTVNNMASELEGRRKERIAFIGSVAHDFKNPISIISLCCDIILNKPEKMKDDSGKNLVNKISDQVIKLKRLADDLLEAAKENRPVWSLSLTSFSLNELLRSLVEDYRQSNGNFKFIEEYPAHEVEIIADKVRISQAIQNLLSNAIKYSPGGSEVGVKLSDKDSLCFIEIKDQGSGIPENQKKKIFEPFSRLPTNKDDVEGAGLGLAILKEIISSHGGTISVKDNPTGGTIFTIQLPTIKIKQLKV